MMLRTRLLLTTLLLPLLGVLVFGGILLHTAMEQQQQLLLARQTLLLQDYAKRLARHPDPLARSQLLQQLVQQEGVQSAALLALDGKPLDPGNPLPEQTGANYQQKSVLLPAEGAEPRLQLRVDFNQTEGRLLRYQLWLTFTVLLLVALLVAGFLALRFTWLVTEPVRQMTRAAQRFRDRDFSRPAASNAQGELRLLQDSLNQMAATLGEEIDKLEESGSGASEDMRRTLEALEEQNIELDLARKETLQASRLKNEFFNSMNHEIRTALNSILGFSRLLAKSRMDSSQREHLNALQQSANVLLNTVNNILDHSRLEEKKMRFVNESFCLRDFVEDLQETLSALAHEKSLEQITLIDSQLPSHLVGDTLRIRQILTNLVSNAIKFSSAGTVEVRVLLESRQPERVTVQFAVSDTGPGISREQQAGLFRPFQQGSQRSAKQAGSGLGLSICKRLAEEMGGRIGIDSDTGKGATFWVMLSLAISDQVSVPPVLPEHTRIWLLEAHEQLRVNLYQQLTGLGAEVHEFKRLEQLPAPASGTLCVVDMDHAGSVDGDLLLAELVRRQQPSLVLAHYPDAVKLRLSPWPAYLRLQLKPTRQKAMYEALMLLSGLELEGLPALEVMVVDDHEGNRRLAQLVLEGMGMHPATYSDGPSAIEAFSRQRPDLVLMDIFMPGMDGKECTRLMRAREKAGEHTPIHALTAELQKMEEYRLYEAGLDGHLVKPLDEKLLHALLARIAASRAARPALPAVFDETLALKRCGGRLAAAREMHELLRKNLPQECREIRELSQSGELKTLLEVVHKLHGGTRYCGVPRLEKCAGELEAALKQEQPEAILLELVQLLLASAEEVQEAEAINAFMSRTA